MRKNGLNSLPNEIQPLLMEYVHLIKQVFDERLVGIYLHGSIALDAFESRSDIDFATVLETPMTAVEETLVGEIHRSIHKMYPEISMDGGYLEKEDVISIGEKSKIHPWFNDNEMIKGSILNPVTGWILQNRGITVIGSDELLENINVKKEQLVDYVNSNMKAYWRPRFEYIKGISWEQMSTNEVDEELEWFVLGIARQFFTLREGDIISKSEAGHYMTKQLPAHTPILDEALRIRHQRDNKSYYVTEQQKFADTIRFIDEVLTLCGN